MLKRKKRAFPCNRAHFYLHSTTQGLFGISRLRKICRVYLKCVVKKFILVFLPDNNKPLDSPATQAFAAYPPNTNKYDFKYDSGPGTKLD